MAITIESVKDEVKLISSLCRRCQIAGSLRRGLTSTHDVDLVVIPKNPSTFRSDVISLGTAGGGGNIKIWTVINDIKFDIVVTNEKSYGAALLYYTGSAMFNISMRSRAKKRGYLLNEYGLYDANGQWIAGETEKDIFDALQMAYREPKDRS